jgi:hypothetical protein
LSVARGRSVDDGGDDEAAELAEACDSST